MAKFQKGNSGRKKGSKNKFTSLKDAYTSVFVKLQKDPKSSLAAIAKDDPKWFYDTYAKTLPREVALANKNDEPLQIEIVDAKK